MVVSAIRALALTIVVLAPIGAAAQTSAPPAAPPAAATPLKPQELDQLVAPIALYPDPLLSEVLIASTYPVEVVQADRWLTAHKDLQGDKLKAAADKEDWDKSVKSLIATPDVLRMMSSKLDWTEKLGDAVLAQEPEVMSAIQRLRTKADANNKLTTTKEQTVTKKQVQGKDVIVIEPTDPNTIYVPYYDPAVVYGAWPYPEYPPYYFPAPGYIGAGLIATGLAFGAGYAVARWATGAYFWGGGVNWSRNNLVVNRPVNVNRAGDAWNRNARVEQRQERETRRNERQAGRGERRTERQAGRGERQAERGERRTERQAGRGERQGERGERRTERQAGRGERQAERGERRTERQAGRGERQAGRQAGRGERQAGRQAGRGERQAGRQAARGQRAGGLHQRTGGLNRGGGGLAARGGGGFRGGGGRGGGRRSDIALKHDIVLLGHLSNGLGFYRFSYNGSTKAYVGIMAQEVQQVMPDAVARGRDGYLLVYYDKLGLKFESYEEWHKSGAKVPIGKRIQDRASE
jgi:Protein of unknown function (DUF3300)